MYFFGSMKDTTTKAPDYVEPRRLKVLPKGYIAKKVAVSTVHTCIIDRKGASN